MRGKRQRRGCDRAGETRALRREGIEDGRPRGLLHAGAREDVLAGYARRDYLDDEAFWSEVEGAKDTALELAGRIRKGDVRHDPKNGECPTWCDLWPMCRVKRA